MGYGSGMGWGWIFWLLMLIGIVLVIVVVVRAVAGGRDADVTRAMGGQSGRSRAREMLDERYARGELTTEEYRERLTALGENE
jgi:putative membrane protein